MISSSLRASSERAWISPPAASISLTNGATLSPLRRPAKTAKPSEANFLAISPPMKSPAPITATVAFLFCTMFSRSALFISILRSRATQRFRELVLEDLAGRGRRQRVEHDYLRGPLVGGQLRIDKCHQ